MKGYPIFWTLDDMATLVFCFLLVECQILISSWIMDLDHACTFFTQTFNFRIFELERSLFLVHGGCPPASITQKRPNHGQVSVHGEPKFIEGQQPYVQ